ncbi:MAG: large repetitive protein [Pseudonocardiales bacterium]|nr:large repetitive protein [Pseudonocardiales bacterium]
MNPSAVVPSWWRAAPRRSVLVIAIVVLAAAAVTGLALAATSLRVSVTSKPKAVSASASASFRWKARGKVLHTLCSLDSKPFTTCKSPKRYTNLTDGTHRFRVELRGSGTSKRIATVRWRVDTTAPTAPVAAGGSLAWQAVPSIAITASGATDAGSGVAGYQSRDSTDGGTTWSAPVSGALVTASSDGETLAQFRSIDKAGNVSGWAPAAGSAEATARLDRLAPQTPVVSGGDVQWQNAPSIDVTATGGADVGGAGFDHYESRTSTDGGVTWSSATPGADVLVTADGETLVQFRSVDAAGNPSTWAPSSPDNGSTVRLDRTIPTDPLVTGGTNGWQNIASTLLTASGSVDAVGGGVAYYQQRTSTDGGTTWSSPATGATLTVSAEGQTLVQFRSVDLANLDSAWIQAPVQIDRTNPTDPTVTGGSPAWQSVPSIDISASASTDLGGSPFAGYQYSTSTDGGATWSAPVAGGDDLVVSEGETLVRFRALDGAGNTSGWVQDTARIDRTLPTAPNVTGGSLSWQPVASVDVTASGSTDAGGSALASYAYRTSTDNGQTWSGPTSGAVATISAEGTTLVQFQSIDGAGNPSAWAPATATANSTVRLDRTPPTLSSVSGGSLAWKNVPSVTITAGTAADGGGSGFAHDEYRTSTDGGATWSVTPTTGSSATISSEGETLVQFRSVDNATNVSAWTPASPTAASTVRIDRTAPSAPVVSGGSTAWQSVPSILITAAGSTDAGSGLAGYQYRTSTDGGATWSSAGSGSSLTVSNQGATQVGFRAIDGVGRTSAWVVADARIDRTAPGSPAVTGGSSTWKNVASITLTAASSSDSGGSGFAGYLYRTSTDGGATWSAPAAGNSLTVLSEGETLVQFEGTDNAANESAWVQATARIDRTAPTVPTVAGGSLSWQSLPSVTISASSSTDAGGSGFSYQYRSSTNGGITWSAPVAGASDPVSAEGTTVVQFQAIDGAGNTLGWTPLVAGAANTVKLDHTAPSAPNVTGGSASWQNIVSLTISASSGSDALSGLAGYDYRSSTNGGTTWSGAVAGAADVISSEGTTLVQFRSRDNAGNVSAWTPSPVTSAGTAMIDRTAPTAPTVSGGSLSWRTAGPVTISATCAADATSGLKGQNVQTSTNGGVTWSAATLIAGTTYPISTNGTTIIQFQAVDNAGNTSTWTPASPGASNTVKLDTTPPTLPTVSGGQGATCKHHLTVSASGSTDATSGFAHYDYRISSNGGSTWGATVTNASSVALGTKGTYIVQFHAVDVAGNISAWAPATATSSNTACIL